jgi:hypothetical protein
VEFHPVSGDFGYDSTFYNRAYYYAFAGYPSLFRDGKDIWSNSSPGDWRDSVNARRSKPSPVTVTISGSYNTVTDSGTITASFRNDSTATISNAMVYFVITEDSLYHVDPNGHAWHNHLARRFLPNTSRGDTMTLTAGQTKTRTRGFKIQSGWNENRCAIAIWCQSNAGVHDVYESGSVKVTSLVPIEEEEAYPKPAKPLVTLNGNLCINSARFNLNLPNNTAYTIAIYDLDGRSVASLTGTAVDDHAYATWNLRDHKGTRVAGGVYLFRLISASGQTTGKIVVR